MLAAVILASFVSLWLSDIDSCLGPGFTQTLPSQDELSQYSTTILQPGNRVIYTTLSFRCNGTLESLFIPSQVRGSDYQWVDNFLEPRPSIWRFNGNNYRSIFESDKRQRIVGAPGTIGTGQDIQIGPNTVLSFNFTVMLGVTIEPGDILGLRAMNYSRKASLTPVIEHLPLLYKPGPAPGDLTPIIIANFASTSRPHMGECVGVP